MVLVSANETITLDDDEQKELRKKLLQSLEHYRKTMSYLVGDAPIGVLCLPKATETILLRNNITRVYDLFDRDLTEIKGIGKARVGHLTSSLNQFITMR